MPCPPDTDGDLVPIQSRVFLKCGVGVLFAVVAAKVVLEMSVISPAPLDAQQIDSLSSEVVIDILGEQNLERVTGSLHEPSDPARNCEGTSVFSPTFFGETSVMQKDGTKVRFIISDCHPCNWPVESGQDVSAFASLSVESDNCPPFLIECFVGGIGDQSSGTYTMILPIDLDKRNSIQQRIKQIAEYSSSVRREDFNRVFKALLSPKSPSDHDMLTFASLVCRSVAKSLNID